MKKIMLLLAAALAVAPAASFAQKMTVTNINREKTYQTSTHNVDIWYEGELNLGFATGGKLKWDDGEKDKTNYSRPFISTIHGARITKYGFVGVGVGVQYAFGKMDPDYDESDKWNTLMIPVFLNLKGYYPVTEISRLIFRSASAEAFAPPRPTMIRGWITETVGSVSSKAGSMPNMGWDSITNGSISVSASSIRA